MLERSLEPNDIINLLSKLKAETPGYPSDLLAARKAAFLEQVVTLKYDGPGKGGKGGGDSGSLSGGSSGSGMLGSLSTAQSILLQAVIGVWIIAAMLSAAYVFRTQIIDLLQEYGIVSVEVTQVPSPDSPAPAIESPSAEVPPTELAVPTGTAIPGVISEDGSMPGGSSDTGDPSSTPDEQDGNPGLHLGQTPGPPDPPNPKKTKEPENKK